ncbi:acetate--CoA ligase family protein [Candidatus Dojkabacteria bacterium]|nr:acetate--CoA ligase family protein [Candidatus Dojkabacteria bacterium]
MNNLDSLLNPKSVAIVGVSSDPGKIGSILLLNIISAGFEGDIFIINPKYQELFDRKVYPSIKAVGEEIDLVCIAIPSQFVEPVVDECIEKNVKSVIIISAGFGELNEEGKALEQRISNKVKKAGIRLLGPNCLGMINPLTKINASFAASNPIEGNIAFLSQSGAVCTAILDMSLSRNLGFSNFVSLGNKSDVSEVDLIKYFVNHEKVSVIGAYLEELDGGRQILDIASSSNKPIVMLKAGETEQAQKAIASHTGSLAGSVKTVKTALNQSGIIQVNGENEMFNLLMGFSWTHIPKGPNVAIVTNAGGPGIIATDTILKSGLKMAEISEESRKSIKDSLPDTASVLNPIDVIGDALAARYKLPIETLIHDDNVDSILIILTPQLVTQIEDTAKLIIESAKFSKKPIYAVFLGGKYVSFGIQRMYDAKVPVFDSIREAVDVISCMYEYGRYKDEKNEHPRFIPIDTAYTEGKFHHEIIQNSSHETGVLFENVVASIATEFGLDLPKQFVSSNIEEVAAFAKSCFPVVMKATTADIVHKTDFKAIYFNIQDDAALRANFYQLATDIQEKTGNNRPSILVQEQIKFEKEFFIGANRDGSKQVYSDNTGLGHLLMFGTGGIYTEIYKDLEQILIPSSSEFIEKKLERTAIWKIIKGARGKDVLAFDKVLNTIDAVQKMLIAYPEIISLDLNPVLVTIDRAICVDVKMFVR